MTFKKVFLTLGLVLGLSGCYTLNSTVFTPQQVLIAANTFDAMQATATNYLSLPLCPKAVVCRTQTVSLSLGNAVRVARKARKQLENFVNANPQSPIPVTLYQTMSAAVSTLQNIMIQNNIN